MGKKESNPMPPKGVVKPPAPPAPPASRMRWKEGKCYTLLDQKAICIGILMDEETKSRTV